MVEIEGTDEFSGWFEGLSEGERKSVAVVSDLLETRGMALGHPYSCRSKARGMVGCES